MPRKKIIQDTSTKKIAKKNIIDSMIKSSDNDNDDVIIQLPISQSKINNIINNTDNEENKILIPTPYESNSYFMNDAENISYDNEYKSTPQNNKSSNCFWCCHSIDNNNVYSMPYNYDAINDNYFVFGSFCSLQCANAYNFSVHGSSDKVWEINSWIQMLAKRYGFTNTIRPAPSRYLLKMFGGNLTIEEFREAHLKADKTYILNIPPMISINSSSEILNTSYLEKMSENKKKRV